MNTTLWITQGLLAAAFGMAGVMKVMQPKEKMAEKMAWVNDFTASQIRSIGIVEILGAIGLILPAATGILPWLTPLAAVGLVLTMIGAARTHVRRDEYPKIVPNAVLLLLALIVVYGRFVSTPL